MTGAAIWIAIATALAGCYFAACNLAIRIASRAKLSDLFAAANREDLFDRYIEERASLLLMTGALRTAAHLVVVLSVLAIIQRHLPEEYPPAAEFLLAFIIAGVIVLVMGVAVPFSWSRYHPEGLVASSMRLLLFCLTLFSPLVRFLHIFDPIVRRVTGALHTGNNDLADEILHVVEEHDEEGEVDESQKEMIEAIIELPNITAGQIMTPRTDLHGIEVGASLDEVKHFVMEQGHSRYPVYEGTIDHVLGILYAKDLIQYIGGNGDPEPFSLRKVVREAIMVPETKPVRELLADFKTRKVHLAVILDEYGGTAGLITIEDIIEELVGEIADEYEQEESQASIVRIDAMTAEVDARTEIEDINAELDLDLPESDDYETIGGYVFATLGHIPVAGESVQLPKARLVVTEAQRNRVVRLRIELTQAVDEEK